MLYSIIPPILILLSLVGIIFFLMKKAPDVAKLEQEDSAEPSERDVKSSRLNQIREFLRKRLFAILELGARQVKTGFSKAEIFFKKLSDNVKHRKERKHIEGETSSKERFARKIREDNSEEALILEEKEKVVKPMISDRVVSPRSKTEVKDQLEDILIERIAINPKDVEAYERLGEYYIEVENYEHAKECYKQVLKLDPSNHGTRFKMRRLERIIGK